MRCRAACLLVILLIAVPAARAERPLPPGFDPERHMRLSEVRDGMTGYGLSVFHGTKIDRFEVQVISVLRNFNPRCDVILIRCQGAGLEHSGGVAGMSGSPVFLRDDQGRYRLAGAFAYGWQAAKDPLAGVQPIEYMLAMKPLPESPSGAEKKSARPRQGRPYWTLESPLMSPFRRPRTGLSTQPGAAQVRYAGLPDRDAAFGISPAQLRPLATPLMTSGIPRSVLERFAPMLRDCGILAVQAGSAGATGRYGPPARLEPGAAIAVPIVTGDMDMTAIGTVTEVLDRRIFAFGHSFFSEGDISLPMGSAYIHSVIPSLISSFKLGAATGIQGRLQNDEVAGIAGTLGEAPATIPVEIRCIYDDGSSDLTYHFNLARHNRLTPIFAGMTTLAALKSSHDLPQFHTLAYEFTIDFANGQALQIANRSVNASGEQLLQSIMLPIQSALSNPFQRIMPAKISGTVHISREAKSAEILSVTLPRDTFEPGQTIRLFVNYRPFRGTESIMPLEFRLPRDLSEGVYELALLDAQSHLQDEQAARPFRFSAQSADEMFAVLRDVTAIRRDALYLRLLRQNDGVAIGRTAMPRLPSSVRKVITDAGRSNTTTFVSTALSVVPTAYVFSGQARFPITIETPGKPVAKNPRRNLLPAPQPPRPGALPDQPAPLQPIELPDN